MWLYGITAFEDDICLTERKLSHISANESPPALEGHVPFELTLALLLVGELAKGLRLGCCWADLDFETPRTTQTWRLLLWLRPPSDLAAHEPASLNDLAVWFHAKTPDRPATQSSNGKPEASHHGACFYKLVLHASFCLRGIQSLVLFLGRERDIYLWVLWVPLSGSLTFKDPWRTCQGQSLPISYWWYSSWHFEES